MFIVVILVTKSALYGKASTSVSDILLSYCHPLSNTLCYHQEIPLHSSFFCLCNHQSLRVCRFTDSGILYRLCLCFLHNALDAHRVLFSMKFHSFPIVFVIQSLCASAKNPTAKLKVSKTCPCFPPRLSWLVPLYLDH